MPIDLVMDEKENVGKGKGDNDGNQSDSPPDISQVTFCPCSYPWVHRATRPRCLVHFPQVVSKPL